MPDGSDITAALQAAAIAAGPGGTVIIPDGLDGTVSAPIDLGGASIFARSPFTHLIRASTSTAIADWKIGTEDNDVAVLYAIADNQWSAMTCPADLAPVGVANSRQGCR
ncbi:MAG: hypothetical protein CMH34_06450 [Microbacterium sp.]|nr:hypothetical protein [Microbacterium sp.]